MPELSVNGVRLHYDEYGSGEPVLLVAGSGASGRVWRTHQVPALTAAGFRAVTVDNRGVPPSEVPEQISVDEMATDLAALIEALAIGPCRVVGVSLGSIIVQELLVRRPELVSAAVLMATRGRSDALGTAMARAEQEFLAEGQELPRRYEAVLRAMQNLSRRTMADETRIRDWLDILELSPFGTPAARAHAGLDLIPDRLDAYRGVPTPCLVVAFADDLLVRPALTREVADHLPAGEYCEINGCGHFGYLEEPTAVNHAILEFFARVPAL
jgi:pimeloyl-ACP methyl ester carboxylesterase